MTTALSIRVMQMTLALTLCVSPASRVSAEIADGEREFVQELLDRAFFDLAEQFCHQRRDAASVDNDRAEWELILSECHEQHAWCMDRDSRLDFIRQSVERLTEFVRKHQPAAELSLLLRMRQIELLTTTGLMEHTIDRPLSNVVPSASSGVVSRVPRAAAVAGPDSVTVRRPEFAEEAVRTAQEKVGELTKLIEERKRDIQPDVVRIVRDRSRLASAQLAMIRAQTTSGQTADALFEEAEATAIQLQKSTNDAALRFRGRMLLAEIPLNRRDYAGFELRFGNAAAAAMTQADRASLAAMKIHALLKQGEPSEALQEFVKASQEKLSLTQELQTLRLQGLLQLQELLMQLDETPERSTLIENTVREFEQLTAKTLSLTCGVWRERCLRLIGRFERVQLVGAQVAADLDYVAILMEQGQLSEAHGILQDLIQRAERQRPELTGVLLMQAGDLSIRTRDWKAAVSELHRATEQFQLANDLPRAASSDLLRIFAIGQLWNNAGAAEFTEQTYRTAIDEHLRAFSQQPTIVTVREWRAKLIRSSSPLEAANELLLATVMQRDAGKSATSPSQGLPGDTSRDSMVSDEKRLSLVGDVLLEALARRSLFDQDSLMELDKLVEQFETCRRQLPDFDAADDQLSLPRVQRELLQVQSRALSLRRPLGSDTDWDSFSTQTQEAMVLLQDELKQIAVQQNAVASDGSSTHDDVSAIVSESADSEAPIRWSEQGELIRSVIPLCHGMIILSAMRQLKDSSESAVSRAAVARLRRGDRLRLVRQLMHQLVAEDGDRLMSAKSAIPGNVQLAHFLMTLISSNESLTPNPTTTTNASGGPEDSVDAAIEELRLLTLLSQAADSRTMLDQRLNQLLSRPLTSEQLDTVVTFVAKESETNSSAARSAREFWNSVQKRTKPGQQAWLEASLQMALSARADGDLKEAARILGVVSVLHPDWGSPQRRDRAEELRNQLRMPQ